jgi:hypothetical protein
MFICQSCSHQSGPGETSQNVVVATRAHVHPPRWIERSGKTELVDKGGVGTQIVREIRVCRACAMR